MIDANMFKRFVTFDRAFQVRVGIVVALLFVISGEGKYSGRQEKLLARLSAEQALVAKIPDMKAALAARAAEASATPEERAALKAQNGFHLEGILIQNNELTALVNGEAAAVGAVIGKYQVVEITPEGVAVSNRETNGIEVIALPNDPWEEKN